MDKLRLPKNPKEMMELTEMMKWRFKNHFHDKNPTATEMKKWVWEGKCLPIRKVRGKDTWVYAKNPKRFLEIWNMSLNHYQSLIKNNLKNTLIKVDFKNKKIVGA